VAPIRPVAKVHYVSVDDGKVIEKVLEPESIANVPDSGDL
jgi:hypothetical protein